MPGSPVDGAKVCSPPKRIQEYYLQNGGESLSPTTSSMPSPSGSTDSTGSAAAISVSTINAVSPVSAPCTVTPTSTEYVLIVSIVVVVETNDVFAPSHHSSPDPVLISVAARN